MAKLEKLRASVVMVRDLFRNPETTEFVIATIPTQLAVAESGRLLKALRADGVPCKRVVVNQVIADGAGDAFLRARLRDQARSLERLDADPVLAALPRATAPLLDLEARGVCLSVAGGCVCRQGRGAVSADARALRPPLPQPPRSGACPRCATLATSPGPTWRTPSRPHLPPGASTSCWAARRVRGWWAGSWAGWCGVGWVCGAGWVVRGWRARQGFGRGAGCRPRSCGCGRTAPPPTTCPPNPPMRLPGRRGQDVAVGVARRALCSPRPGHARRVHRPCPLPVRLPGPGRVRGCAGAVWRGWGGQAGVACWCDARSRGVHPVPPRPHAAPRL